MEKFITYKRKYSKFLRKRYKLVNVDQIEVLFDSSNKEFLDDHMEELLVHYTCRFTSSLDRKRNIVKHGIEPAFITRKDIN